jgi:hypothetical protein
VTSSWLIRAAGAAWRGNREYCGTPGAPGAEPRGQTPSDPAPAWVDHDDRSAAGRQPDALGLDVPPGRGSLGGWRAERSRGVRRGQLAFEIVDELEVKLEEPAQEAEHEQQVLGPGGTRLREGF